MLNGGEYKIDNVPVCDFEGSAYEVKAPGKSLNTISDGVRFIPKPSPRMHAMGVFALRATKKIHTWLSIV